ncbi:MAG: SIMPL domain-containing protein [Gemmatimonadota bacterium]|nr:SIMPL domain-containing protein [Gemmatimonadota bacterium]
MRPRGKAASVALAGWLLLGGCAGSTAGGSEATGGNAPAPRTDPALEEPNVYEVPVEAFAPDEERPAFIQVRGGASVTLPADRASVTFAVETRAVTATDAAAENANLMDAVLRAVREAGFADLTIETFGYTLQPDYIVRDDRSREIEGYTSLNNVRARVHDMESIGSVVDAAIAAGANRIASIDFEASDTEAARSEALAEAVRSARSQARAIAASLGYELGPVLEVRGGADRSDPPGIETMLMRNETASTPIEAGTRAVSANVTVRFALGSALPGGQ